MASIATSTSEVTTRRMLPIIFASTLGTAIEWYDFFLYGTTAALVFPKLFFPTFNSFVGTILSLTTFLVGFIARPLGGAFFGHFGDRIGRKSTLVATLLLMGVSTVLVGLVPGYTVIGVAAPLLISLLRFCQGLGVGGEWGGSVLLVMEHAHSNRRGFWASWAQVGAVIGLLLSAVMVAIFSAISGNQFDTWGWRVPFLFSIVLILIGLFIRLRIAETPLFAKVKVEKQEAKAPIIEVFRLHGKEVFLTAGARFVEQAPFYLFATFVLVYGVEQLHLSKQLVLSGIYIAAIIACFTNPLFAHLSDGFGRKRWYLIGCVLMMLFAFPYFLLLNSGVGFLVILSIALSLGVCHAFVYGPQAALIAEHFSTKVRYSGASLGYQLAAPFAGGLSPIIAVTLLETYHGSYVPVAIFIIIMAAISFLSVLGLRETAQESIDN